MGKLPSLNGIRAFEATARHLSVTLAAHELHVTPGAVSRKVRQLETELGTTLFLRGHQQIALTRQGVEYFKAVSRALGDLREATRRLDQRVEKRQLRIRAYTTFSMRWLIPRLPEFHARFPDIEVSLTASLDEVDFAREDLDGAIRLGDGQWRGVNAYWLVANRLCPVMSPGLPGAGRPLSSPADLAKYPLLHSLARPDDWADWLAVAGAQSVDGYAGPVYQSSAMAYAAAIQGQGIAMAQLFLVERELREGELIQAFDFVLDRGKHTYYLLTPSDRSESSSMTAFREWMLELFSEGR